jgi:hypothetical protein
MDGKHRSRAIGKTAMSDKVVLVFAGHGGNDAIRGLMDEFASSLVEIGMNVVQVMLDPAELQMAVSLASEGKVAFGLTYLGIGQDLQVNVGAGGHTRNLWEALELPLLKIHGDIPAYFADRHRDTPTTSVNLYVAEEFMHFRRRWLPSAKTIAAVVPPMAIFELRKGLVDVEARRKGRLVFVKNGNPPDALRAMWRERLPTSTANLLTEIADEAARASASAGRILLGDFVAAYLQSAGMDTEALAPTIRLFTAQVDDYVRRVKSEMIASALLDFPIVVQGDNWGHVDFTGRKAQLVPGRSYEDTRSVFTQALGIIDMSPNTQGAPHERIWRAAGCYTLAVTNRQTWFDGNFAELSALEFDFNPESIRSVVGEIIANPSRYIDAGISFGEQFRTVYPRSGFANKIVDYAELAVLQYGRQKPSLQPYFAWSSAKE